jgi:hypothetical protein
MLELILIFLPLRVRNRAALGLLVPLVYLLRMSIKMLSFDCELSLSSERCLDSVHLHSPNPTTLHSDYNRHGKVRSSPVL